ncbi:MAG TPA: hypothetical protein VFZ93_05250 [Albitalea sp.]
MRASPAFRICIRRFGAWRAAVAALFALTVAVQAAWLAGRAGDVPLAASAAVAAIDLVLLAVAARALRVAPVELHWDTRAWRLRPADAPGVEPAAGTLAVALDLGPWMLLRFDRATPGPAGRTWLPVQRRGLESQWHALRCAVYCARSVPGTDAGTNLGARPESQE